MKTNVLCLLDRSGSMQNCHEQTIEAFNKYIDSLKGTPDMTVTLVLFDNKVEQVYRAMPIDSVPTLTKSTYTLGGGTALLDALGTSVNALIQENEDTMFTGRNLVVVITDGEENASREFKLDGIKSLIDTRQKEDFTFVFLSADPSAFAEAGRYGIAAANTIGYSKDAVGANFDALSNSTKHFLKSPGRSCTTFTSPNAEEYEQAGSKTAWSK